MKINPTYAFVNEEYKKEWEEWVPGFEGEVRYCEGIYNLRGDGTKVVYDGATNYMGSVKPDGTFISNSSIPGDEPSEYELTFLRAAAKN